MKAAVVTVSTSVFAGESEDESGPLLVECCRQAGLEVTHERVSDDRDQLVAMLKRLCDHEGVRFVFTTGGTGMTLDDVTPEATRDVLDRDVPGYAEAMRAESLRHTPMALLSRGTSGTRGRTLIVNFPGSPKSIEQLWGLIEPTLGHAVRVLERE